jgi:hypothetical protein
MRIDAKFLEILAFKAFKHDTVKKYIGICNSDVLYYIKVW